MGERQAATEQDSGAVGAGALRGYSPDEERPVAAYAGMTGIFLGAMGAGLFALKRSGRELPPRVGAADVIALGIATHKLSRLLSKDKATSFLRAPFTRLQESAGHGELEEEPRGKGLSFAIGELLVCPYCLAQWVVGAGTLGLVGAPRVTRLLSASYAALAISDFLQLAYHAAGDHA